MDVLAADGRWLAHGAYSSGSQISVRVWSFDLQDEINSQFFHNRLSQAIGSRQGIIKNPNLTAYRLVHAESDGLPGLIVDRYAEFLVCQFLTAGAYAWKKEVIDHLLTLMPCRGIYERSDVDVRTKEGLELENGLLYGDEPPELVLIQEGPVRFLVDVRSGHKTGFYLDQRENRMTLGGLSRDAQVLNCFSYSGGFGVWALKGGATSVVNVDSSGKALDVARMNLEINGLDAGHSQQIEGDVFVELRRLKENGSSFDRIILDPPKFAERRTHLRQATRGYKDINMVAFQLMRPGGLLLTFSCSGLVTRELFQKIVADAALDAGRNAQILYWLSQASDHPVSLPFPEGLYLKGLMVRVS